MACVILHNMVIEDEQDDDLEPIYAPNPPILVKHPFSFESLVCRGYWGCPWQVSSLCSRGWPNWTQVVIQRTVVISECMQPHLFFFFSNALQSSLCWNSILAYIAVHNKKLLTRGTFSAISNVFHAFTSIELQASEIGSGKFFLRLDLYLVKKTGFHFASWWLRIPLSNRRGEARNAMTTQVHSI